MTTKQKILIVDDVKGNLVALRQVLSELDVEFIEASSGNEALAATIDHNFALALLDVQMPGMTGYELAEHLRGDKKTRMIPIVFLTASYGDELHIFKGYDAGAVDYIMKPFPREILLGKVKAFLEIAFYRSELEMRIKELKCLYSISSLVAESSLSIDELLKAVVELIPLGVWHPETTCARIVFENREVTSSNYRVNVKKQSTDIMLSGKAIGTVEVCHLEEGLAINNETPPKEEQELLINIARQIGIAIGRKAMQEKLLASEKLAVMGRFIADVSHEINNPLAIISGNVQLLAKMISGQVPTTPDSENKTRMLEKAMNAIERCKKIVASLLVSTRSTILELHFTDINKVIVKSLESMNNKFTRQNVTVIKTFTVRRTIMEADEHRLEQVFINMFSNACDAMPEGGKLMITTRLHETGASGEAAGNDSPVIEIEISDTGKGIEANALVKIFDPFTTTKKDGKGVGLGLSISSGIIREHGGTISVTSEKGKGATFIIRLPVLK